MSLTAIHGFSLTHKEVEEGRILPELSSLTLSILAPKPGGLQEVYAEKAEERARKEKETANTGLDKAAIDSITRETQVAIGLKNTGGME